MEVCQEPLLPHRLRPRSCTSTSAPPARLGVGQVCRPSSNYAYMVSPGFFPGKSMATPVQRPPKPRLRNRQFEPMTDINSSPFLLSFIFSLEKKQMKRESLGQSLPRTVAWLWNRSRKPPLRSGLDRDQGYRGTVHSEVEVDHGHVVFPDGRVGTGSGRAYEPRYHQNTPGVDFPRYVASILIFFSSVAHGDLENRRRFFL